MVSKNKGLPVHTSPKVVGIRFGDNDFSNCIRGFLNAVADRGLEFYKFDKAKFVELFNRSISGFYWTCQNGLEYDTDWNCEKYLKITEQEVYFDDEVKEYLEKCKGWSNGEFFVIDTTNEHAPPYVYSA